VGIVNSAGCGLLIALATYLDRHRERR